ncbi:hypothetical protein CA13_05190 [Planctomycetes bacterium CA13]|uniref:DUF3987 domain-containing protein n=1 Tax=Novipirellula herctigrandis TaxID=2527986 RepID=A0A5C5YWH6_9BACT|nr:hypothetical protein CA13_05190 [Planctomycetes bacterium CA13]
MASNRHPKASLHPNSTIDFDAIPTLLTERDQWVLWREVERDGRPTKIPYQCDGITEAKSDDRSTWASFDDVRAAYDPNRHSGVGFVFADDDPFFGVDLDSCILPDDELVPWANEVVNCLSTYAEVSPSGVGLKLIGIGDLPTEKTGRTFRKGLTPAVEGKTPEIAMWRCKRYFTITGNVWGSTRIYQCPGVAALWDRLFAPSKPKPNATNGKVQANASNDQLRLAVAAMCRMDMTDGNDGSRRLYAAACRCVGWNLSDQEALQAIRSYASIQPFPKNWPDGEIMQRVRDASADVDRGGELREREQWLASRGNKIAGQQLPPSADDPWSDPEPIERPVVPPFPVEVLPEPLRSWVAATAEATQVPADLPGLLALAVCAGAVARRVEVVAGRKWREPINLYVACLLDPGNRKSAVFASAMRPLRAIEHELIESAGPDVARLAADRRMREAELKELERKGAKGCGESREGACELAAELAVEPVASMPKLLVDDATAEAIEMHLASQCGRLVVAGCEGGLFDVMAGRYSSGMGNLDCFLKGHAGDDLRVDRVERGSLNVPRCCLTLAYAVQPEVIRGLAGRPSFRGRGLIGRFLYSVPETTLGRRRINPEPVSEIIDARYETIVRRLARVPDRDDGLPELMNLTTSASRHFEAWQHEVEGWLAEGGRLFELRDWGGKLCGLTARLAAVMHLVSVDDLEPWTVPIDEPAIVAAIEIGRWAVPHAEAVIGLMTGSTGPADDAVYVLRWIRESGLREFSRRDAHVHGRARFDGEPNRLDDALELLVDRGWIRPVTEDSSIRRGRPASPRFSVHPEIENAATRSHNTQKSVEAGPESISVNCVHGSLQSEKRMRGVL